jgi:hypothetical protein
MNYAYIHCRPDGNPFYVGKGKLRRVNNLRERNPHHTAIVAKHGRENILVGKFECSSEAAAYELEIGLIKCITAMGTRLANYTIGGDGGRSPCEGTRKKLSEAAKKRGVSQVTREASRKALRGRVVSQEERDKISAARLGAHFTEEHRKNISLSAKRRGISPQVREAQRRAISIPVLVDGIVYESVLSASVALGCSKYRVHYALRNSGVVDSHTMRYA